MISVPTSEKTLPTCIKQLKSKWYSSTYKVPITENAQTPTQFFLIFVCVWGGGGGGVYLATKFSKP